MKLIFRRAKVVDHFRTGCQVRRFREQKGISLRQTAVGMDISPPYLSDLERGNRNWTQFLLDRASRAISRLSA